jgi:hypothetical protein
MSSTSWLSPKNPVDEIQKMMMIPIDQKGKGFAISGLDAFYYFNVVHRILSLVESLVAAINTRPPKTGSRVSSVDQGKILRIPANPVIAGYKLTADANGPGLFSFVICQFSGVRQMYFPATFSTRRCPGIPGKCPKSISSITH